MNRVILLITASLFSLYGLEMGCTFLNKNTFWPFQKKINRTTYMQNYQAAVDDIGAQHNINPNFFLENLQKVSLSDEDKIFPISGRPNSIYIAGTEYGIWQFMKNDEYGFRNKTKQQDAQVFILGDSFAQGMTLPWKFTLTYKLAEALGQQTYSLGYGGNSTLIEYGTLIEYVSLEAKSIIWIYHDNDLPEDLINEYNNPYLKNYLQGKSQNLLNKTEKINKIFLKTSLIIEEKAKLTDPVNVYPNYFTEFITLQALKEVIKGRTISITDSQKWDQAFKIYEKILASVRKRNLNKKILFVYIPANPPAMPQSKKEQLFSLWNKYNFKFLDFSNLQSTDFAVPIGGHLSPAGVNKVVNHIKNSIQKDQL